MISNAGTYDSGPVLTAATAGRAAVRFNDLTAVDASRMDKLLRDASSHERAYLMKALAAGYDVQKVSEFAATIHPYGDDLGWLDQHLTPFHTAGLKT